MHDIMKYFGTESEISRYVQRIESEIENNQKGFWGQNYLPIVEPEGDIFLSVIIRTQGKREDGLREALLCLQAQSCDDFEVILIAHNAAPDKKEIIRQILDDQMDSFRQKIRYFELDEGGRAAPLNFGFAKARGHYAAIFDDDDLLFADWVEAFANCAKDNDGRILHSYAFAQDWEQNASGYGALSAPKNLYCSDYDLVYQLKSNRCPLMTLAFPLFLFKKMGYTFNEALNVTEDWDFFMRMSFLCGVSDIRNSTAVYRFWKNMENSATLHSQEEWSATYRKIQQGFGERNILTPIGALNSVIGIQETVNSSTENDSLPTAYSERTELFYGSNGSFQPGQSIVAYNMSRYPMLDTWFVFPEKQIGIECLRFDPSDEGMFILEALNIDVWTTDGVKTSFTLKDCIHNGVQWKGRVLFLRGDPQIIWKWDGDRMPDYIHVTGVICRNFPRKIFVLLLEKLSRLFHYSQYRKFKNYI